MTIKEMVIRKYELENKFCTEEEIKEYQEIIKVLEEKNPCATIPMPYSL